MALPGWHGPILAEKQPQRSCSGAGSAGSAHSDGMPA